MKTAKISARVTPRVRRIVETAADEEGTTLSSFTAAAVEERARRMLLAESRDDTDAHPPARGTA